MPCQARQQPVLVRSFRRFVPSIVALLELIHCPHQSWKLGKAGGLLGSWLGAALVLWSSVWALLGLVSHLRLRLAISFWQMENPNQRLKRGLCEM